MGFVLYCRVGVVFADLLKTATPLLFSKTLWSLKSSCKFFFFSKKSVRNSFFFFYFLYSLNLLFTFIAKFFGRDHLLWIWINWRRYGSVNWKPYEVSFSWISAICLYQSVEQIIFWLIYVFILFAVGSFWFFCDYWTFVFE